MDTLFINISGKKQNQNQTTCFKPSLVFVEKIRLNVQFWYYKIRLTTVSTLLIFMVVGWQPCVLWLNFNFGEE